MVKMMRKPGDIFSWLQEFILNMHIVFLQLHFCIKNKCVFILKSNSKQKSENKKNDF